LDRERLQYYFKGHRRTVISKITEKKITEHYFPSGIVAKEMISERPPREISFIALKKIKATRYRRAIYH